MSETITRCKKCTQRNRIETGPKKTNCKRCGESLGVLLNIDIAQEAHSAMKKNSRWVRLMLFILAVDFAVIAVALGVGWSFRSPTTMAFVVSIVAFGFSPFIGLVNEDIKRLVTWKVVAVAACVTTVIVASSAVAALAIRPLHNPLINAKIISLLDKYDPLSDVATGWKLIVPNPWPALLSLPPTGPVPQPRCPDLWRSGVEAGGEPPTYAKDKVTISGNGDVTLIDLRAKILNRSIPAQGAALSCITAGAGTTPDEPVSCNLSQELRDDSAECLVKGEQGQLVSLLASKTVPLHDGGDPVTFQLTVKLPNDSVEWQFQARIITPKGDDQWIPLGSSVRSLGLRDTNAGQIYRKYVIGLALPPLGTYSWQPGDQTSPPNFAAPGWPRR